MSLSHASPDELLPETPDPQESAREVLPDAAGLPRKRFPLDTRKFLRNGGIVLLTLSLVGSLSALIVMGRSMSELTIRVNTLDAAFRSGQIGQLTSNVSAMEERLKTLEQQVSTLASLPAALQSAGNEQTALKATVRQLQEDGNSGNQAVAQLQTRVSSLEHDVQQSSVAFSAALGEINRQLAQKTTEPDKPRTATEAVKTRTAGTAKKINRSVRRVVTQVAPFVLTGIERRGGQTFAVVIPRGASQISAMRLLSPGDTMLGWTLRSTEGSHAALFVVNGSEQRLQTE